MGIDQQIIDSMLEEYGPQATACVAATVSFFSDLIAVDRANGELMKAGTLRMARVINDMLPHVKEKRRTGVYDYRDLNGVLNPIPEDVQTMFVGLIGTLMINASDGPFQAAAHLNDGIDQLVSIWKAEEL